MQTLAFSESPEVLPERQRTALISLLVDDDPAIYQMVRRKLLHYGQITCQWLRPQTLSSNPVMRRRALEIVTHLARQAAHEQFLDFCRCNGEDLDLELATGMLARTQDPAMNLEGYQALYDSWAGELAERIRYTTGAEPILSVLNRYFFGELHFAGHEQYGDQPACCYVNRIADNRTGSPIGLCAVYLFIARRLRLPITGIDLPGHFICRYQSSTREIYIDCFHKGALLSKGDCLKYLLKPTVQPGRLSPVSSRRILLRMCHNLHLTYGHLEMTEEAARVQRYVAALSK